MAKPDNMSRKSTKAIFFLSVLISIQPGFGDDLENTATTSIHSVIDNKTTVNNDRKSLEDKETADKVSTDKNVAATAEVKRPPLSADKSGEVAKTEKSLKNKSLKKKGKTANEIMSSDDTTREYVNSVDPSLHYEKARALAADKKYSESLKEINAALGQNPKYYEAKYLGILIFEQEGRKQEAAKKYKQLLLEKPNYLQARISFASLLADLGQDKDAEVEYRKAIDLSFMSCESHYNLANLLTKENRFKEALQELRICLKLKPDNAAAHNNMGVIYYHQNYKEESEKEFQQASELDPANKIYLHNLELIRGGDKNSEPPSLG